MAKTTDIGIDVDQLIGDLEALFKSYGLSNVHAMAVAAVRSLGLA